MRGRARRCPFRSFLHDLLGDQRGATAVEAALVLPIMIFLSLGAIETARGVSAKAAINHAAKETARFASVRGEASEEEATQASLEAMAVELTNLPASSVTASVSWDPDNSPGSLVIVQMQHVFTPVALSFLPEALTLDSTASMAISR